MLNLPEDKRLDKNMGDRLTKSHPIGYMNVFIRDKLRTLSNGVKKAVIVIVEKAFDYIDKKFLQDEIISEQYKVELKNKIIQKIQESSLDVIREEIIIGMYKDNEIYTDNLGIENIEWSDFVHDVQQSMFFSKKITLDKEQIINNISEKISDLAKKVFQENFNNYINEFLENKTTELTERSQEFLISIDLIVKS